MSFCQFKSQHYSVWVVCLAGLAPLEAERALQGISISSGRAEPTGMFSRLRGAWSRLHGKTQVLLRHHLPAPVLFFVFSGGRRSCWDDRIRYFGNIRISCAKHAGRKSTPNLEIIQIQQDMHSVESEGTTGCSPSTKWLRSTALTSMLIWFQYIGQETKWSRSKREKEGRANTTHNKKIVKPVIWKLRTTIQYIKMHMMHIYPWPFNRPWFNSLYRTTIGLLRILHYKTSSTIFQMAMEGQGWCIYTHTQLYTHIEMGPALGVPLFFFQHSFWGGLLSESERRFMNWPRTWALLGPGTLARYLVARGLVPRNIPQPFFFEFEPFGLYSRRLQV